MGTGWYHSGRSHEFLGFDVGVRTMLINIPDAARTFTASVMACSARTGGGIDTFYVDVEGAASGCASRSRKRLRAAAPAPARIRYCRPVSPG